MSDLSDYAEKWLLDILSGANPVANRWLALYSAVSDAEGGVGTEMVGAGYARQPITFDAATLGTGATTNNNTPKFTSTEPSADWPAAAYTAVMDAVVGGNALTAIKAMPVPKTNQAGDSIEFQPGDVDMVMA